MTPRQTDVRLVDIFHPKFDFLAAVRIKIIVLWDIASYSLVLRYQRGVAGSLETFFSVS